MPNQLADIIDVTVTFSPDPRPVEVVMLPPRPMWATRQERYAWRREVFGLLQPELEPWTYDVLFAQPEQHRNYTATQATLDRVHHALCQRLREAGVFDVFAPVVNFTVDDRGIPCVVNVALALTSEEIHVFGEQPAQD